MEKNKVVIKGSFKGIAGDLTKNIFVLLLNLLIYLLCDLYKDKLYEKHNVDSFLKYLTQFESVTAVIILAAIYLVMIIIAIISIAMLLNTFKLFYELNRMTSFDFSTGKITSVSYSFPFIRSIDENKFNEVINVNISQSLFQRFFSTGHMYIEYIKNGSIDSQVRFLEIPFTFHPFQQKNKIL